MGGVFAALKDIVKDRWIIGPYILRSHGNGWLCFEHSGNLTHDAPCLSNARPLLRFNRNTKIGGVRVWKQAES